MTGKRTRRRLRGPVALLAAMTVVIAGCGVGGADRTGDASFDGETLRFVVSFGEGGGYDFIARTLAPFLEEELGATVVVENREGAGGLLAANTIFTGEPDGRTFGIFSGQGIAGAVLGGAAGVKFELLEFSYVARVAADPRVLSVGAKTPYATIDDVIAARGFRFGSSGPGGSEHIDATVLFPVLGVAGQVITGYDGSAETELAVTSGDVDGTSGTLSTRLPPIENGDHGAVLVIGREGVDELPDVPALLELDLDDRQRALAEAHTNLQDMGRMVWAPPGVPAERLQVLRTAFERAVQNPEFTAEMEKAQQGIEFLGGDEAKQVAESVLAAPDEYVALLEKAYRNQ